VVGDGKKQKTAALKGDWARYCSGTYNNVETLADIASFWKNWYVITNHFFAPSCFYL
jgi:hypothetical protein